MILGEAVKAETATLRSFLGSTKVIKELQRELLFSISQKANL
jgi:hypothetical protein